MRVVHIIDTLQVGGAQKLLIHLARETSDQPFEWTIASLGEVSPSIESELAEFGVRVVELAAPRLVSLPRFRRLESILREGSFDVIHTHLDYANILGAIVGKKTGIPVVATLHNTRPGKRHGDALRSRLEAWALRRGATRIIAVGWVVAEAHADRLRGVPMEVLPNAVARGEKLNEAERYDLRVEMTGDPDRLILAAVGRLAVQKGYDNLLEAFASVRRTHREPALVIAGTGDLQADLERDIVRLGLEGQARLLGLRHDVPRLLAAADLFVSASHWEGLPLAALEAMAAGLPVVATSVGDLPRVVSEDVGVLVPSERPDELAKALRVLLDDPQRRQNLGTAARAHVEKNYAAGPWVDRLLELYEDIGTRLTESPLETCRN